MREFSSKLNVQNKERFAEIYYDRLKCYLRRDIYEHVLHKDENDYFSLDDFNRKYNNIDLVKKAINEIIPELEALGWKCKSSFGGTALFIYSTETPPPSCWEE
jgi:hypothetical protein